MEDLKKKFGDDEYAVIEGDGGPIFVFHKEYSPLRRNVIQEIALSAAMRLGDSNGAFSYGDLTPVEQVAVGELFGEQFRVAISDMRDRASNVKIALGANVSLTAVAGSKQVRSTVNPRQDNDAYNEFTRDLEAHGVEVRPMTKEEVDRQLRKLLEMRRANDGMSIRFLGVHKKHQAQVVRLALEALERFLGEERVRAEGTHADLTDKLLLSHAPEFSGAFPESMAKRQVPSRIWQLFESQLRANPASRGFEFELDLERFLASVTTVRLETSFLLTYMYAVPSERKVRKPGTGVQIEIRR